MKALMLTYGGDDINDIVENLPADKLLVPADSAAAVTVFTRCRDAISEFFNPEVNIEFQRYTFRQCVQETDSIDDFFATLRQMAPTCN